MKEEKPEVITTRLRKDPFQFLSSAPASPGVVGGIVLQSTPRISEEILKQMAERLDSECEGAFTDDELSRLCAVIRACPFTEEILSQHILADLTNYLVLNKPELRERDFAELLSKLKGLSWGESFFLKLLLHRVTNTTAEQETLKDHRVQFLLGQ